MKNFVQIKKMRCPVCGSPMVIDRVTGLSDPCRMPEPGKDLHGVEITYICSKGGHVIRTSAEFTRGFIDYGEAEE